MKRLLIPAIVMLFTFSANASETFSEGKYKVTYDSAAKTFAIECDGSVMLANAYTEATYNLLGNPDEHTISSKNIAAVKHSDNVSDCFGEGISHYFVYDDGTVTMSQHFNFYGGEFFICYSTLESNDGESIVQSRYLVPLAMDEKYTTPMGTTGTMRMIWVPFDNDGHGRYHNYSYSNMREDDSWSHEVSGTFDPESRRGIVAGSVDHDKWKSGIQIYGRYNNRLYKFKLQSGFTNETTRDALPHGKVKGKTISSARYMVGIFDDWREGFNTFGDCCIASTPRPEWNGGNPVGWSTYGVQQERVNEKGVVGSVDFLKDNFHDAGLYDSNGILTISFDACANDNIADFRIQQLIKNKCNKEDMALGMYAGPLCLWPWGLDGKIDGTGVGAAPAYQGRHIALKVNGEVYPMPCNGALAVDPTHPAVKLNIEKFMKKWAGWGVKYVKADFLNCGIIEGDSWYDPEITTGVMAYNYGMKLMYDIAKEYGIYIVEAMSPLFPYNYAHGRRTCCDRFSKIDETEYVMNAISYGWWTDRLYTVNDPDQLVLVGRNNHKSETIGENRARATSGMATGAYIWGDNFSEDCVHTDEKEASKQGVSVGEPVGWVTESKQRALEILSNKDVNEYVRTHIGSFMPVEGGEPTNFVTGSYQQSERLFYRNDGKYCYVAAFCFSKQMPYNTTVTWQRLGLDPSVIAGVKELWTDETVTWNADGLDVKVPKSDARVYRIDLGADSGVEGVFDNLSPSVRIEENGDLLKVSSSYPMATVSAYHASGMMIASIEPDDTETTLDLSGYTGIVIINVVLENGKVETLKILR